MKFEREVFLFFAVASVTILPFVSMDLRQFFSDLRWGWSPDAWLEAPATLQSWTCKYGRKGIADRITVQFRYEVAGQSMSDSREYRAACLNTWLNPMQGDDIMALKQGFPRVFYRPYRSWDAHPLRPSARRSLQSWFMAALGWFGAIMAGIGIAVVAMQFGKSKDGASEPS